MLWRIVGFLSLFLGEALTAPYPGTFTLPNVPYGQRLQYYILKKDGSYKEGYDSGDGQYKAVSGTGQNEVDGKYGFKNPNGEDITFRYKAGVQGFVPEAYGLKSPLPEIIIPPAGFKFVDPLANPNPDASYNFEYKGDDHGRSETSDAEGNVYGQYHYYTDDGGHYRLNYKAGAGQGFVVDIDTVAPPSTPPKSKPVPKAKSLEIEELQQQPAQPFLPVLPVLPPQPAPPAVKTPEEEFIDPLANPNVDKSYDFSFKANDHGREETSDAEGNVQGQYHFYTEDGGHYRLKYRAGAGEGFVVDIDAVAKPAAPSPPAQDVSQEVAARPAEPSPPKQPEIRPIFQRQPQVPVVIPDPPSNILQPAEGDFEDPLADPNADKSYDFSFKADDHGRHESSDAEGNVEGGYHFYTADGGHYRLNYQAGADQGFVVNIEEVPGQSPAQQPPQPKSPVRQRPQVSVPEPDVQIRVDPPSGTSDDDAPSTYSFSYNTGDQEHTQSSDGTGTVTGNFAFVADDGVKRRVDYKASSDTGFVAKGDHIPKPQQELIDQVQSFEPQKEDTGASPKSPLIPQTPAAPQQPAISVSEDSGDEEDTGADRSYSFSYHAGDSARTEISDSDGTITGFFTFLDDQNKQRTVVYNAGKLIGFLADGKHLPVSADLPNLRFVIPSLFPVDRKSPDPRTAPEISEVKVTQNPDGTYSFSFVTTRQSRSEKGYPDGKVEGTYTFVNDKGETLKANYRADSESGFVVEGEHIPKAPSAQPPAPLPVIPARPPQQIIPVRPIAPVVPVQPIAAVIPVQTIVPGVRRPAPQLPVAPRPIIPAVREPVRRDPIPAKSKASDTHQGSYKFGERIALPEGELQQWLAGQSPEKYGYIYREQ